MARRTVAAVTAATLVVGSVLALLLGITACQPRERPHVGERRAPPPVVEAPMRSPAPPSSDSGTADADEPGEPSPRALPPITGEPLVRILLVAEPEVRLVLERGVRLEDGTLLPAGGLHCRAAGSLLRCSDAGGRHHAFEGPLQLRLAGSEYRRPSFAITDDAVRGRHFAGDLRIAVRDGRVQVNEVLPMERYLLGVIAREVEPDWPLEALKAQAVAARSYATARWLDRHDRSWHLNASEQVDMAYAGLVAQPHPRLATAVAQTRGDLLWYHGQPLPAYFYAASGGHSEDLRAVWPERTMPDAVTSPAGAFVYRPDPWDRAGRAIAPRRLGAWRFEAALPEVRRRLEDAGHGRLGAIASIRITERDPASDRARRVRVAHTGGHLDLSAHQLRMAMGSTAVKSTLWRDLRVSGNRLVIQGHGYGHGIGLPQASSWAMARAGHLAPQILAQYYPGARLTRKW